MSTLAPVQMPRWEIALNMILNPGEVVKNQAAKYSVPRHARWRLPFRPRLAGLQLHEQL